MPNTNKPMAPPAPTPVQPDTSWEHYALWTRVREVIKTLPQHFRSSVTVTGGISAAEVFTLGSAFASVIETEVARTLNETRLLWDPDGQYHQCAFARQAERFPDILFLSKDRKPIFGIELKSWYLLAKEGEPSLRFRVSAKVPTNADLFVVVPWAISSVLTGAPVVYEPYVELAKYVAEYRNYWWQYKRETEESVEISSPLEAGHYPSAREEINDVPVSDRGGNFGRVARIGIMDDWIHSFHRLNLLGISVESWRKFLKKATSSTA